MENATKALLIAGSVLIAILLIAFGLRVFNSTKGTVESSQTTMNATAVTTFNSQFLSYCGGGKTKNEIIQLTSKVISSNASSKHKITMNTNNSTTVSASELMQNASSLNSNSKYTVTPSYGDDGYIYHIDVE